MPAISFCEAPGFEKTAEILNWHHCRRRPTAQTCTLPKSLLTQAITPTSAYRSSRTHVCQINKIVQQGLKQLMA
jgi:hypothetical protein